MIHGLDAMPTSTQDDMSGNPLQEGILGDWQSRAKRDESFASVRQAGEFDIPGTPDDDFGFNPAQPTHKFIVTGDGSVFAKPEPTAHEYIAQTMGDTEAHLNNGALGRLFSNGDTDWDSNGTRLSPQELQEALSGHFGYPVDVDPSHPALRHRNQAERFGIGDFLTTPEEASAIHTRGRPFGYYDNPFINRGGAVDFETEAIALPGHTTFDATPTSLGLHGDVAGSLRQLGAYVNGRQVDLDYAKELRDQAHAGVADPVMVSHPDPEKAELAKQLVEQGNIGPMMEYAQKREAAYPATIRTANGITDNLHKTLGNLRAWVENPHENGQLRPYYNGYHTTIRPALNQRGSFRIGVQNPQMGEIINHVAQTDDMGPLYEYRGQRTAGGAPLIGPIIEGAGALLGGGGAAAGASAAGAGGLMGGALGRGVAFQAGKDLLGGGGGQGGAQQAAPQPPGGVQTVQDPSYYAATEDDLSPSSHGEVPKNDDGDSNQKDDGDNSAWQKQYDVNDTGGTDMSPKFSPDSPGIERMVMLLPLIEQFFNSDEAGSNDPLLQSLDQALEQEIPGYKDHADEGAAHELLAVLKGGEGEEKEDDGDIEGEPTKIDEGGAESKEASGLGVGGPNDPVVQRAHELVAAGMSPEEAYVEADKQINGAGYAQNLERQLYDAPLRESRVDFLPYLPTLEPSHLPHVGAPLPGDLGATQMSPGMQIPPNIGPSFPGQVAGPASPTVQSRCPHCSAIMDPSATTCPQCGAAAGALPGRFQQMQGKTAAELPNSFLYEDPGLDSDIQPGVTLDQYRQHHNMATPSNACQGCGSHIDPGDLVCHVCGTEQEPGGKTHFGAASQGPHTPEQISVVQQYLIDQGRVQEIPDVPLHPENYADILAQLIGQDDPPDPTDPQQQAPPQPAQEEAPPGATMPVPGMSAPPGQQMAAAVARYADFSHPHVQDPTADERHLQHDHREEQDTGHTWMDDQGNPLQVGMYYELHSERYDIPDLVRIDAVKPASIVYTIQGNQGLEHGTEVQKEEADIMGYTFTPSAGGEQDEVQPDSLETNNDDNTAYEGSPEMSDLSSPHSLSSTASSREWLNEAPAVSDAPGLEWLNDGSFSKQAGKQFSQWEQRGFIEEKGVARNADKLDLSGTHYQADSDPDEFLFGW